MKMRFLLLLISINNKAKISINFKTIIKIKLLIFKKIMIFGAPYIINQTNNKIINLGYGEKISTKIVKI
jgi:hypothetical protein